MITKFSTRKHFTTVFTTLTPMHERRGKSEGSALFVIQNIAKLWEYEHKDAG